MSIDPRQILKSHLTTERTTLLREENNAYVFSVAMTASKHQIKEAVEKAFGVKVAKVRTMRVPAKPRRLRSIEVGYTPSWKKAIVCLKEGQNITVFENI